MIQLDIPIVVVPIGGGKTVQLGGQNLTGIGERYIGSCQLGGITLRGPAADSPMEAVRALLWEMTAAANSQTSRDAEVALGLALDGRDITDLGKDKALPAPAPTTEASNSE